MSGTRPTARAFSRRRNPDECGKRRILRAGHRLQSSRQSGMRPQTVGPDGALAVAHPLRATRMYAAGKFAYRSDDSGLNWTNVTRTGSGSILGGTLSDTAVSPRNPEEVVVAGSNGLWRSMDGGESWSGLNDGFPNLPVERILAAPGDGKPIHIAAGGTEFVWAVGERLGMAFGRQRPRLSPSKIYAPPLRRLWELPSRLSPVRAMSSMPAPPTDVSSFPVTVGPIGARRASSPEPVPYRKNPNRHQRRKYSYGDLPTLDARGRVLRTNTSGVFWEDLSGNLPANALVRGIAFDRESSAVYAATDRGVFHATTESGASRMDYPSGRLGMGRSARCRRKPTLCSVRGIRPLRYACATSSARSARSECRGSGRASRCSRIAPQRDRGQSQRSPNRRAECPCSRRDGHRIPNPSSI